MDSRKLKTTWIRISENPDCPLKIWSFQIRRTHCQLCKDEACAYVRSVEDGNGYQAWQALLRARTARNATNVLNQLPLPTLTSPDPRINLRQWNKNAEEHATRTGERVSDGIRRAFYMNKFAPQDMRQHLMLNQSRLSTAEEVKISGMQPRNFRVMIRVKLDSLLQLVKAMRKVENLMECQTTLERVVARRAKEKCAKDSDSNPSVVSRDVVEDTVIGVGELATKKPSVVLNKST